MKYFLITIFFLTCHYGFAITNPTAVVKLSQWVDLGTSPGFTKIEKYKSSDYKVNGLVEYSSKNTFDLLKILDLSLCTYKPQFSPSQLKYFRPLFNSPNAFYLLSEIEKSRGLIGGIGYSGRNDGTAQGHCPQEVVELLFDNDLKLVIHFDERN